MQRGKTSKSNLELGRYIMNLIRCECDKQAELNNYTQRLMKNAGCPMSKVSKCPETFENVIVYNIAQMCSPPVLVRGQPHPTAGTRPINVIFLELYYSGSSLI